MRHYSEVELWKDVTQEQWDDWRWQVRNIINLTKQEEEDIEAVLEKFRVGITPYYASLMDPEDPHDPVRMQAVPTIAETHVGSADLEDPLDEDADSPVPGLTHRYPDRVL